MVRSPMLIALALDGTTLGHLLSLIQTQRVHLLSAPRSLAKSVKRMVIWLKIASIGSICRLSQHDHLVIAMVVNNNLHLINSSRHQLLSNHYLCSNSSRRPIMQLIPIWHTIHNHMDQVPQLLILIGTWIQELPTISPVI